MPGIDRAAADRQREACQAPEIIGLPKTRGSAIIENYDTGKPDASKSCCPSELGMVLSARTWNCLDTIKAFVHRQAYCATTSYHLSHSSFQAPLVRLTCSTW